MKSIIKTSFFTVLLMAAFSIGFSNAYAEDDKTSKTENNIIIITAEDLQSQQQFKGIPFKYNINLLKANPSYNLSGLNAFNLVTGNMRTVMRRVPCSYGSCPVYYAVVNSDGEIVKIIKVCQPCMA